MRSTAAVLFVAAASSEALAQDKPPYVNADGTGTNDLQAAMQSWRDDPEFQSNWGLKAMHADGVYALGFTGKGIRIGVFDSGIRSSHQEFGDGRLNLIDVKGFSTDGKQFAMSGEYNPEINDDHGTAMTGLVVASRNNKEMHGVAFDSPFYVANTGGTDALEQGSNNPALDFNFFKSTFDALGEKNVRMVNESWGSGSAIPSENRTGSISDLVFASRNFWKLRTGGAKTWLDATVDGVRQHGFVQVVSNGNNSKSANPDLFASQPFLNPDVETKWLAVTGYDETGSQVYHKCGVAKWWCIMGPSGMTSTTTDGKYMDNANGTSASSPNISGALALVMNRYPYMSNEEAVTTLLTTAQNKIADPDRKVPEHGVKTYDILTAVKNSNDRVPNELGGWGLPDLQKAMAGPGQFFGHFAAGLPKGMSDTWANDISDEAITARKEDDVKEQATLRRLLQKGQRENGETFTEDDKKHLKELIDLREKAMLTRGKDPATGKTYVGSLEKLGDGHLVLAGKNTYGGSTWVRGGNLSVDGSITSTVTVDGSGIGEEVEYYTPQGDKRTEQGTIGGTIGGTGTIGGLIAKAGGTVEPGSVAQPIGTLKVGNVGVRFEKGSTYAVAANSLGASDRIETTGTATLNGGTVEVHPQAEGGRLYLPETRYQILTAVRGVNGQFDKTTSDLAFLDPSLDHRTHDVGLTLTRNDVALASTAATANETAVAVALENAFPLTPSLTSHGKSTLAGEPQTDATPNPAPAVPVAEALPAAPLDLLPLAILNLSKGSAGYAWAPLSGEVHATVKGALTGESSYARDAVTERLRAAFDGAGASSVPVMAYGPDGVEPASAATDRFAVWGEAYGAWETADGDGNAAGYHRSAGGFLVGGDVSAGDWRLGLAGGYGHSSYEVDARAASAEADNYTLALYSGARIEALSLNFGAAHSWHSIDTRRGVVFPGFADSVTASYDARTAQVFGEAGYELSYGFARFEPFANLAHVHLKTDGYREEDKNGAGLTSSSSSSDVTYTTLGLHHGSDFDLGGTAIKARGTLGWRHAFGDVVPHATHAFAGGQNFTIIGTPVAKDAAIVQAGLDFHLAANASLAVSYEGQIASSVQEHGVTAKLGVRF
ncbi:autotransporter domain-containing protein [Allomesorhizobium alhagi]|uniref:Outer membrane autotransporter barrel domain-containing protein n=1 Tax=Mesorhizobium alhagi CCNWXJ12-2 TaxID=1107882 RepID=H0HXJ5_9HYPH|nr:autotransporter serine protease [Mesorhizobium alhagi]EHK54606.1 outer membrane autotransporter barrel domain-containing protein [Mesorhizobium alhagi CCNWXJ12-2]